MSLVAGEGWTMLLLSSRSLLDSFCLEDVFFRLGEGILHSILKATQLVQGTPRLAASQRTFRAWQVSQALEARCLLKLGAEAPCWLVEGGDA